MRKASREIIWNERRAFVSNGSVWTVGATSYDPKEEGPGSGLSVGVNTALHQEKFGPPRQYDVPCTTDLVTVFYTRHADTAPTKGMDAYRAKEAAKRVLQLTLEFDRIDAADPSEYEPMMQAAGLTALAAAQVHFGDELFIAVPMGEAGTILQPQYS